MAMPAWAHGNSLMLSHRVGTAPKKHASQQQQDTSRWQPSGQGHIYPDAGQEFHVVETLINRPNPFLTDR